jgi:hypothetical protein
MNEDRLAELIERPEVQQRILGDYDGGYSLGLTLDPCNRGEIAIRVRIETQKADQIPPQVVLDGEAIPVIVNTSFKIPEPLKGRG